MMAAVLRAAADPLLEVLAWARHAPLGRLDPPGGWACTLLGDPGFAGADVTATHGLWTATVLRLWHPRTLDRYVLRAHWRPTDRVARLQWLHCGTAAAALGLALQGVAARAGCDPAGVLRVLQTYALTENQGFDLLRRTTWCDDTGPSLLETLAAWADTVAAQPHRDEGGITVAWPEVWADLLAAPPVLAAAS